MTDTTAHDRYREAAGILHDIAKPMRVLSALSWPAETRERFLADGAQRLPEPEYSPIDPTKVLDGVAAARRLLRPGHVVDDWLDREATSIESTALMLSSVGTPAFHAYSRKLYGVPTQPLRFDPATPLELAQKVHSSIEDLSAVSLLPPVVRTRTGEEVAEFIEGAVKDHFGDDAPEVLLVDELSANAVALARRASCRWRRAGSRRFESSVAAATCMAA